MKNFVILSTGAYSEYNPRYYYGLFPITQEELDKKGKEIGDIVIKEFLELPEVEVEMGRVVYTVRQDKNGQKISSPDYCRWFDLMELWLLGEMDYEKVPEGIPEVNVYYDVPSNIPIPEKKTRFIGGDDRTIYVSTQ